MKAGLKKILSITLTCMLLTTTVLSGSTPVRAASENDGLTDLGEHTEEPVQTDQEIQEQVPDGEPENEPVENEVQAPQEPVQEEPAVEVPEENAPAPEAPEEKIPAEEATEEETVNTQTDFTYTFTDMMITVSLENPGSIPAGSVLKVKPVFDQKDLAEPDAEIQNDYNQFQALFDKQAADKEVQMSEYLSFAISFEKDGDICLPQGKIHIVMEFYDGLVLADMEEDASNVGLFYLDSQTEPGKILLGSVVPQKKSVTLTGDQNRIHTAAFELADAAPFTIGTYRQTEEKDPSAEQEEKEDEKEEKPETVELSYEDKDVQVAASYQKGVLPEGVSLKADQVEDQETIKIVEDALKEQEPAGMLAYDIRFEKDGREIEPDGQVNITLAFKEAVNVPAVLDAKAADGESTVSVYHLKEEKKGQVTAEELKQAEIKKTEQEAVEKAVFTVDSFSVFVLTWTNQSRNEASNITASVRIHAVDQNGQDLVIEDSDQLDLKHDDTAANNPGMSPAQIKSTLMDKNETAKAELERRQVLRAYVEAGSMKENYPDGVDFTTLYLWKEGRNDKEIGYQVKKGNMTYHLLEGDEIYLVFSDVEEPLKQIGTLSTSSLIDLTLFDYFKEGGKDNYSQDEIGGSYWYGAQQGLVKDELAENGMPVAKNGTNLSSLFAEGETANKKSYKADHLFYQDAKGYYYYNSAENYAYFNQSTGNFEIYNWIATDTYAANKVSRRTGNFLPFTKLPDTAGIFPEYGVDDNGKLLHKVTGASRGFGMKMEFNFIQPEGGRMNGEDMVFEFNGDDDVFVFIDGRLVLDIGGSHEVTSGYINFSTGEVYVERVGKLEKAPSKTTYLNKIFSLEGRDTFEDWSQHKLSFFYTDRGGASNCKIKFNIPAVPKDGVTVKKEITNINEGAYSDVDFQFKLYVEDEKGTVTGSDSKTYSVKADTPYTLYAADGVTVLGNKQTEKDGTFTLKHGQMASFAELGEVTKKYFIEEVNVSQAEYDEFKVTGTDISGENKLERIPGEKGDDTCIIRSMPLNIGKNTYVNFLNTCAATNLKNLTIEKQMAEGQTSDEIFQMKVKIGGEAYTGRYKILVDGMDTGKEKTAKNGVIELKAGEAAVITNIPSGTSFEVEETGLDSQFKPPVYEVKEAEEIVKEGKASGVIHIEKNAAVLVTNEERYSRLVLRKTIDQLYDENGDAVFTFKITGPKGDTFYHTFRFTKETEKTQSFVFEKLPFGIYQVEELDTLRYTAQGTTKRTAVLNNEEGKTVEFVNNRTYEPNYSHTDVVVNRIHVVDGNAERAEADDLRPDGREAR